MLQPVGSATRIFERGPAAFRASLAAAYKMADVCAEHERLPRTVNPINYRLDLVPNFTSFTFTGRVSVELQVVKATKQIIFNSKGLDILSASYQDTPAMVTNDDEVETVTFDFPTNLQVGCVEVPAKRFFLFSWGKGTCAWNSVANSPMTCWGYIAAHTRIRVARSTTSLLLSLR
eukprot:TsM_000796300 transcript=TsM_000796300 gene=TsM_000796300